MAKGPSINPYEEARKQRLEENKRRFQELGVAKFAEILNEKVIKIKNTSLTKDQVKKTTVNHGPLRRSSRPRTEASYVEEFVPGSPRRKRLRSSSLTSYVPTRVVTNRERSYPLQRAKRFQSRLSSENPSCIKSLRRTHVSNFMLSVPREFCHDHFPDEKSTIVLEDEEGSTYETKYLGDCTTLSGGWKSFVVDHELDDGDALVFELTEPRRLKVYIFRVPNGHGVGEAKVKAKENSVKKVKDSGADEDVSDVDAEQIARPRERRTRR